jgi:putative membrane protein
MTSLFAFLHHVTAFTLVASLAIEFVLIRDELSLSSARKLQFADKVYGASAGALLAIGFLRVMYFEKGPAYYFHSIPFIAKLSLFVTIGLVSIYPTVEFLSWSKAVKQVQVPMVSMRKMRSIRTIIHWELVGVVLIVLCAALMARGVGYVG